MSDGLFTPAAPVRADSAAINLVRAAESAINLATAMQRIAIGRAERMPDGSHGCVSEPLPTGTLICIAELATTGAGDPLLSNGQPLYRTRFEFHGQRVSRLDAERLLMGLPIEVAA